MKRNWIVIITSSALFAACGDNTTESTYKDKDTTTTTTITPDPNAVPSTPVYNPPDNVRVAFQTKYPTATNVTWSPYQPYDRINWEWTGWPSMDTSYYAVNYTVDNRQHWGWYDRNNNWIGSTSIIEDSTMLPDPVKKTLKNSYAGYKITSIDEENDKNRLAYEIKLEKGDARARVLIDKNGKILKKDTKA
ncbi:MAG TPA: PepSY domain-containing protein [Chitinophagaceae bacterium]|nr:PepSY domain-containing protein [Chitinophagaceae bacterium]